MDKSFLQALVLAATLLAPLAIPSPLAQVAGGVASSAAASAPPTARVIVKYRVDSALTRKLALSVSGQRSAQAQALGARLGIALTAGAGLGERTQVVTATGVDSAQLAARLAAESDIEYAVADERKHIVAVPNDPLYASRAYDNPTTPSSGGPLVGQWYLKPPSTSGAPSSIDAEHGWDVTTGSSSVVVAVLDTGVRFDHPDLQGGNVLPGYDMISADADGSFSSANDGDGRDADASDPGDYVTSAENSNRNGEFYQCGESDSSWHGTQTLGLIGAASDNATGIASVGRNVRVMPVRVLGKCGGYDSDIIAGMLWAAGISVPGVPDNVSNKARVINMSLGGTGACSTAYQDAVNQVTAAGATVVVAAGNSAGHVVGTPANCTGVIAVTGLRHVGTKVGFSDLGPEISISAPGGNCVNTTTGSPCLYPIVTTSNAGTTTPVVGAGGGIYTDAFNASLGTSFSAPLVAATAALLLSTQPTLTPADVKAKLQSSARAFPTSGGSSGTAVCTRPTSTSADQLECYCTTATCGAGMLDVAAALQPASGVQPRITVTTSTPTAGAAVTLSAADSTAASGRSIASYRWALVDGGGIVTGFVGATDGVSASVTPTATGTFTVSLTTTSDLGIASTVTSSITVAAAPSSGTSVVTPPPTTLTTPSSSSGGGGALDSGWLLLLAAAVAALARERLLGRRTLRPLR